MDDIEDLIGADDEPANRLPQEFVQIKNFKKDNGASSEKSELKAGGSGQATLPGKGKVYVKTWGCAHNNSDGEYMAGQLASQGYSIVNSKEGADVWLLNSCTVKNPSQDVFINEVKDGKAKSVPVIVAGCVPQGQPKNKDLEGLSIIGVQQIDRVVEVVEEALKGHSVQLLGHKRTAGAKLNLPKIRKNKLIEIIPINTGCLNQCTYCKTKHARGDLRSYPVQEIAERVKQVVQEGVVEIWLTSEDTGTYGRDIDTSLPDLLWELVKLIPDGVMLRVGMTNPPYIMEHLEEMVRVLSCPNVYAFLHVPVQACSDKVLFDMKRQYTCQDFCTVVDRLVEGVEGMTIATDVICGFPTETEQDFEESLQVFRKYQFPVVNISQFYARHGTPAARMKRVPTKEVKRRSTEMTRLFESYSTRDHLLHTTQRVLVTEVARDTVHFVGHNKSYDQVLVPKDERLMGKMVEVKIVQVGKHFMKGEVLWESLARAPVRPPVIQLHGSFAHDGEGHEFFRHLANPKEEGEEEAHQAHQDQGKGAAEAECCGGESCGKGGGGGGSCSSSSKPNPSSSLTSESAPTTATEAGSLTSNSTQMATAVLLLACVVTLVFRLFN